MTTPSPSPYLAIVPVAGTDVIELGDVLAAAQRQWSRLGHRECLPSSALALSQLADLGPCWVIRNPEARTAERAPAPSAGDEAVRPASPADIAAMRASVAPSRPPVTAPRPAGVRLAYSSGGDR